MVLVDQPLRDVGLDCPSSWVSFSCTGDFATKDSASRSFDMAQIALLTGATVHLRVDDTKKHNQYCFASRIDLYAPE